MIRKIIEYIRSYSEKLYCDCIKMIIIFIGEKNERKI